MQEVVALFRTHKKYDQFSDAELRLFLFPSFNLDQYKKHYEENELIGFTNWAYLSKEAEARFKRTGILQKNDWKSGGNIWHIETVVKRNLKDIMSWTKDFFSSKFQQGTPVHWLRVKDNKPYRKATRYTKEWYRWVQ